MAKSLLSFVAILKDEAHSVTPMIESVRDFVDRYDIILDDKTSDDTADRIRAAFGDKPGEIVLAPFKDFASQRNLALDLGEESAEFTLMLSGDETLKEGGAELRAYLQAELDRGSREGSYRMRCFQSGYDFASNRISRAGGGHRYAWRTHEVMVAGGRKGLGTGAVQAPGRIFHDTSRRDGLGSIRAWRRDVDLLMAELITDPQDARATFYLAQSHELLREIPRAIELYERRIRIGGPFTEEVFAAAFRAARCMRDAGRPWPDVMMAYLRAHSLRPTRAEPLYDVGAMFFDTKDYANAYIFLLMAARLPYPKDDLLCIETQAYDRVANVLSVAAWYMGEFEQGEASARAAFQGHPLDPEATAVMRKYTDRRLPPPPEPRVIGADGIVWLLPSLNRPESLARCFAAYRATGTVGRGIVLVDGNDWSKNRDAYAALTLPDRWTWHQTSGVTMGDKLRETWDLYRDAAAIGLVGDDNVPENTVVKDPKTGAVVAGTPNWDAMLAACLTGANIVSSNDDWRANRDIMVGKMAGATLFSGDLLRAIGYLFPPGLAHFIDDFYEQIGRAAACWVVRTDVMVRHIHPMKPGAKLAMDETYRVAYDRSKAEHAVLTELRESVIPAAIVAIMTLAANLRTSEPAAPPESAAPPAPAAAPELPPPAPPG